MTIVRLAEIRSWKLSRLPQLSNESVHDPTGLHLYRYPLSFLPHVRFYSMPDYGDENHLLTSPKRFGSIRFRRTGTSGKRRNELKATISGPHAFGGSAVLGDAPLRAHGGTQLLHSNSVSTVMNEPPPTQQAIARGLRRNSDIPLRRHYSTLEWPTNHPEITPFHGSHHPRHTTRRKLQKVGNISRPLEQDSSRFSYTPGVPRKKSRRPPQISCESYSSGTIAHDALPGNPDGSTSRESLPFDEKARGSDPLDTPSDDFDPRTMEESLPALNLDFDTSSASFGSVKQRTRTIDKALRASRTTLLLAQEKMKPDLVYTDDSDGFSSPPSTPSTLAWETVTGQSVPQTDPKLATKMELADIHAQIQAMIDSANRPPSTDLDYLAKPQAPSSTFRNDILPSLQPKNPIYKLFPRLSITHRRSASSPPLGSGVYHAYPPDFRDRSPYRPTIPVKEENPTPPASPPPEIAPTGTTPTIPADPVTPVTPTKKPSSERSDSPSVYSQQSPSSQIDDITPTSSNASSPDHPYAKSKHERLLAAISEGISSPTKPGPVVPTILGSGRHENDRAGPVDLPPRAAVPPVPIIVVTDANNDNLVYSESNSSIVDMYSGSAEGIGAGQRRRTRTASSVSHVTLYLLTTD